MSEWSYVIAAYALTWAVVLGLAAYAWVRDRNATRSARLARRGGVPW